MVPALVSLALMRAAVYRDTGAARDVLRVDEVGRPEPGPGEVLVRVHASGVNPTDFKTRAGTTARPIDGFQIPHHDGAGVIEAVGPSVDPQHIPRGAHLLVNSGPHDSQASQRRHHASVRDRGLSRFAAGASLRPSA